MEDRVEYINRKKSSAALISVISNGLLTLLKLTIGIAIGSVSVISEAIHSSVDLLAALIALFAVRTSGKPADRDHPFGHGKYENISGTAEALLIFLAAGWIIYEAAERLMNPVPLKGADWGVAVMAISSTANILVSRMLFKVGQEADSVALLADAWHLRTDVYTAAGVMTGLAIIWLGGLMLPEINLSWIDPLAAIGVALLIIRAAYRLTVESARDLLDISLPTGEEATIKEVIATFAPEVRGFHKLCTRKSGSYRFVEFHMVVDPAMTIDESHRIADMVGSSIKERYPGTTVTIHIEPCKCSFENRGKCDCLIGDDFEDAKK